MALRTLLYAAALIPAFTLIACGDGGPDTEDEAQANPPAAMSAQTARCGDAVSSGGETVRGPEIEAVAQRFGLTDADTIMVPTLYRAVADISSTQLTITPREGDPGYITVSGMVDPDTVLRATRRGLSFELSPDRVTQFLDQPVIVTLIARTSGDRGTEPGLEQAEPGERPALRAAWVEPSGAHSGWRTMNLTGDWQKTVFTYDAPSETAGTHLLTIVPPGDQPVDIAALAIRTPGAADGPGSGAGGPDNGGPNGN
jgi:hypothetical protein